MWESCLYGRGWVHCEQVTGQSQGILKCCFIQLKFHLWPKQTEGQQTFGVKASTLPERIAVLDVLSSAPPATDDKTTVSRAVRRKFVCNVLSTSWWKEWRPSSSPRPRRSKDPEPGSSRSRLYHKRRSGAATPASSPHPMIHTAVAARHKIKHLRGESWCPHTGVNRRNAYLLV